MPGLDQDFVRLKVAKAWGMSPAQFRAQPEDDKAAMIAFEMFGETCETYRWEWKEKYRALCKDGKEPPVDKFSEMRAEMGLGRVMTISEKIDRMLGVGDSGKRPEAMGDRR